MANENAGEHVFLWQIQNFPTNAIAPGRFLETPIVVAEGLDSSRWRVLMYPRGREHLEHIGVFLHRCTEDDGPKVLYLDLELCLIDKDGNELFKKSSVENRFTKGKDMGFPSFLHQDEVINKKSDLLPNDVLTLKCRAVKTKRNCFDRSCVCTDILQLTKFTWPIRKQSKKLWVRFDDVDSKYAPNCFQLIAQSVVENDNVLRLAVVPRNPPKNDVWMVAKVLLAVEEDRHVVFDNSHYFEKLSPKVWNFETFDFSKVFGYPWKRQKVDFSCVLKISAGGISNCSHIDDTFVPLDSISSFSNDMRAVYERTIRDTPINEGTSDFDVVLTTTEGNENFRAHQNILSARSPVFREIFDDFNFQKRSFKQVEAGNNSLSKCEATVTKEGITVRISEGLDSVVISDISPEILRLVLQCMYTDSLDLGNVDEAILAYKAASYLQFPLLQFRIVKYLRSVICPANLKQILTFAYGSGDAGLKADYRQYIRKNRDFILSAEEWGHLRDDLGDIEREILLDLQSND